MTREKNLGLTIADATVASISSLNNSPTRTLELYEKIRLAQEETDQVAKNQKRLSYYHGISAIASIGLAMVGQTFVSTGAKDVGEVMKTIGSKSPEFTSILSNTTNGNITLHQHASQAANLAQQRITSHESTDESLLSRNIDQIGRLLAKEV